MPAPLALLLGYGTIAWLLREDLRWRSAGSRFLVLAGLFLAVIGSRPLSYWLGAGGGGNAEGNPINTAFFAIMLVATVVVLNVRQLPWGATVSANKALFALYGYFFLSAGWSVDPPTSAKRLVKDFVCVLLALGIRTEIDALRATRATFVRVAYVLFPLSAVFGKYYPSIGRAFSMGGEPMFTGVTTQKNSLGEIAFVFGAILLWDIVDLLASGAWQQARRRVIANLGVLMLGGWLLVQCDSKTSLVCLIVAAALLLARSWFIRRPHGKSLLIGLIVAAIGLYALDNVLGVSEAALRALNRNPTLTGRTDIWRLVLEQQREPWLGGGFYMFWDSDKGKAVGHALISLNSAHSGYIETYLDGGVIGCALLGIFLLTLLGRAINRYFDDDGYGAIGLPLCLAALFYNLSESSFLRLDPLWFALLLVTTVVPLRVAVARTQFHSGPVEPVPVEAEP